MLKYLRNFSKTKKEIANSELIQMIRSGNKATQDLALETIFTNNLVKLVKQLTPKNPRLEEEDIIHCISYALVQLRDKIVNFTPEEAANTNIDSFLYTISACRCVDYFRWLEKGKQQTDDSENELTQESYIIDPNAGKSPGNTVSLDEHTHIQVSDQDNYGAVDFEFHNEAVAIISQLDKKERDLLLDSFSRMNHEDLAAKYDYKNTNSMGVTLSKVRSKLRRMIKEPEKHGL